MKQLILACLFIFLACQTSFAQDSIPQQKNESAEAATTEKSSEFEEAITAYNDGDFRHAINILEQEREKQIKNGLESVDLYYNLGNAYFRVNELAHARLNYERALLLDPGDRDTRHNIDFIMTKIEDKIVVADTFFLHIWFKAVQNLFSSNTWAIIAIVSFLLFTLCLIVFFFSRYIWMKKTAFYIGIILAIVIIFANIYAFGQKNKIEYRSSAVIMTGSATVLSSPDINSKELFTLHAGTKVEITKEDRNWLEIEIENGHIGWIQREKLEII